MSEQKKVSHDVLVDLVESIIEDSIDEPQFSTWEHALMGVEKIRDEYLAAHDREVKAAALREAADEVAREHRSHNGFRCACTRHLIEVTEQAVRANVAAEIRATGSCGNGCKYAPERFARIAEGKQP